MEAEGLGAILTAIGGLAGGVFGGIRLGKNQQLEEVKGLINEYQEIHRINKEDLADIRLELGHSKKAEELCFQQHREAMHRIDELDRYIRAITNIPPKPTQGKTNG
jgi:hypothetical protein